MSDAAQKRTTVYFDPLLHRALHIKAAVRSALAEDVSDIEAFEVREREPDYAFEDVVKGLKRRGEI